jgi:hypothetical protein
MKILLVTLSLALVSFTAALAQTPSPTPTPVAQRHQSSHERIVEIEKLLAVPLTGDPKDADKRVTLRAELAALKGGTSVTKPVRTVQITEPQKANTSKVVVAKDSASESANKRFSRLDLMTGEERARYFEELRLKNTQTVVIEHR